MTESSDDREGRLSRWSRRKAQARAGVAPAEPVAAAAPSQAPTLPSAPAAPLVQAQPEPVPVVAMPTLADVAALGPDADYARFVMPGVDEGVKRAAMKKLFASSPHFNVMDGLDTYIDDYGKPDPIPAAMLRRLVRSRVFGLVGADKDPAQASTDGAGAPSLPQSPTPLPAPDRADEDTALRLQPDDAADAAGARADRPDPRA